MNNQIKQNTLYSTEKLCTEKLLNTFYPTEKFLNTIPILLYERIYILIAENLSKFNFINYFSVALEVCPCILTRESYQEFKNGFGDGFNMIHDETNKKNKD
jgi:hypothetical protein